MPNFNINDILSKATEALQKSSADHARRAEQNSGLIELINDPGLRSQVESIVGSVAVVGFTVVDRLKAIFAEDAEAAPAPAPKAEPTPENPLQALIDSLEQQLRDQGFDSDGRSFRGFPF